MSSKMYFQLDWRDDMCDIDEDDELGLHGMYEGGHWLWDERIQGLAFVSSNPDIEPEMVRLPKTPPTGSIEFRDNIDLMEQLRFRRRYQRKIKSGHDVITIQDIKDIALFTAPVTLLSPQLINLLHVPTTERFIRALILCLQYYLQIRDEMAYRVKELEMKIRTPECDLVEKEYRDNLADLRLLVAKEYCAMILGAADMRKFHHMGYTKKKNSLSDKDARLFETLMTMCIQITWLALGRTSFHQIELEVNRVFKSEIFNSTEHTLRTGYLSKMSKAERSVLLGHCVKQGYKLNKCSPLMDEIQCNRKIDYRVLGLGVVKYSDLTPRLKYMLLAISSPEEELMNLGITVGILGMHRSLFDTMLHPLPPISNKLKSKGSVRSGGTSVKSASSLSQKNENRIVFPKIVLPPKERKDVHFPAEFPTGRHPIRACSDEQRRRWQQRQLKLVRPRYSSCPAPLIYRRSMLQKF